MTDPVRVLVVDDSAFMRKVVMDLLQSDPQLQVVGTARDGLDALEKLAQLNPDVITLDIEMPRLDGLGTLRRIMSENPHPVVMVSSLTQRGADATIAALTLGAVDFVPKPSGAISLDLHKVKEELIRKVKMAARVQVRRFSAQRPQSSLPNTPPSTLGSGRDTLPGTSAVAASADPGAGRRSPVLGSRPTTEGLFGAAAARSPIVGQHLSRLVLVASSTGGPGALHRFLDPLPKTLRGGLVVVQHMPAGFTHSLAMHLDQTSGLMVREAQPGDRPGDGLALVAPGGHHLALDGNGLVSLGDEAPRHGVRPAADVTFESIPESLARKCIVIIMTGMGMDGARGAKHLKEKGAQVWAQDETSCVVYGMPRAVVELGIADRTGTPEQLCSWLMASLGS